eukprot:7623273-Prorocentrum_lima.AAC.1
MTSSLVGSEMCIRDRPGTVWKIRRAVYGLKESPRLWLEERDRVLEEPVSYTHLTLPTICSV